MALIYGAVLIMFCYYGTDLRHCVDHVCHYGTESDLRPRMCSIYRCAGSHEVFLAGIFRVYVGGGCGVERPPFGRHAGPVRAVDVQNG